jgi:hypothetical protein
MTLPRVAQWAGGALAVGLLALIAMVLVQMRENGRYQGVIQGFSGADLIIIDTRTGEWLKTHTERVHQQSSTATGRQVPYNRWMPVIYADAPATER